MDRYSEQTFVQTKEAMDASSETVSLTVDVVLLPVLVWSFSACESARARRQDGKEVVLLRDLQRASLITAPNFTVSVRG